ncbi:conjugal transfer protein [Thioalkalivibrio denitrificans]|uniref:Conjugal transfer protein n=1 Tax=Thioalkalivibrio denitrificans TaxID=108003 RepID=A0A1V3NVS3_9GAMM|nr:conjugal transfer protein [Thioalkalivibrio denitrificans]
MDPLQTRLLRTDRLNGEPVIFRGCSSSELMAIAGVSATAWLPLGIIVASALGAPLMGVGAAAIAVLATVYVAATLLQRLKRGRPEGHYQHRLAIVLDNIGVRKSGFIRRSGTWDVGRSL